MESEGTFLEGGAMRLIIAYIQPETLMDVKQALFNNGIVKMSVTNALGCAAESGFHEKYRGADVQIDLLKKVRLEVALREENVDMPKWRPSNSKARILSDAESTPARTGWKASSFSSSRTRSWLNSVRAMRSCCRARNSPWTLASLSSREAVTWAEFGL